ncbi:MAG: thiamine biosynthesis protein [Syntrophotaleaceae bacterium]
MSKALGLLSGGLDSILAAMVLKKQGVDVTGIVYVTPFFGAERARKASRQIDIPLIVRDISEIHLEMLKNPRYGYGRNLNPCIDCHAMMFRIAGELVRQGDFDFLFSGEVLGQRPMSQNLNALQAVAKHSGCGDFILRPLSARLLPVTAMEEKGLVDREQLLNIQGRTRRRQEELARQWGLADVPSSGGGCLLTEKSFTARLQDLLNHHPDCTPKDVELLKLGRQYRLSSRAKLTLGRNRETNEAIKNLADDNHLLLRAELYSGPLGLISGHPDKDDLRQAAAIVAAYGKGKDCPTVRVLLVGKEAPEVFEVAPMDREKIEELIVP